MSSSRASDVAVPEIAEQLSALCLGAGEHGEPLTRHSEMVRGIFIDWKTVVPCKERRSQFTHFVHLKHFPPMMVFSQMIYVSAA